MCVCARRRECESCNIVCSPMGCGWANSINSHSPLCTPPPPTLHCQARSRHRPLLSSGLRETQREKTEDEMSAGSASVCGVSTRATAGDALCAQVCGGACVWAHVQVCPWKNQKPLRKECISTKDGGVHVLSAFTCTCVCVCVYALPLRVTCQRHGRLLLQILTV